MTVPLITSSGTVGQWDTVTGQRPARARRERRGLPVVAGTAGCTLCETPERLRLFSKREGRHVISVRRHLTKNRPAASKVVRGSPFRAATQEPTKGAGNPHCPPCLRSARATHCLSKGGGSPRTLVRNGEGAQGHWRCGASGCCSLLRQLLLRCGWTVGRVSLQVSYSVVFELLSSGSG